MVEYYGGKSRIGVDDGADAKQVGHHRVDSSGFLEYPNNSGCIVTTSDGSSPGWLLAHFHEYGLLYNQCYQFEVRVCYLPYWVIKADKVVLDVCWPLQAPCKIGTVVVTV